MKFIRSLVISNFLSSKMGHFQTLQTSNCIHTTLSQCYKWSVNIFGRSSFALFSNLHGVHQNLNLMAKTNKFCYRDNQISRKKILQHSLKETKDGEIINELGNSVGTVLHPTPFQYISHV